MPGAHGTVVPTRQLSRSLCRLSFRVVGETLPVDDHARFITDDPCIMAGGHHGKVAWAVVHLFAIVHNNLHSAADEVAHMCRLAAVGARNRPHMLRPLPAWLEGRTPNRATRDIDVVLVTECGRDPRMAPSDGVVHGRGEPVGVNLPAGGHRARLDRPTMSGVLPTPRRRRGATGTSSQA